MSDLRFTIEFEPPHPGARVRVNLFDRQSKEPARPVERGQGDSREAALLDLWRALHHGQASDAAIATIEGSYHSLTGKMPFRMDRTMSEVARTPQGFNMICPHGHESRHEMSTADIEDLDSNSVLEPYCHGCGYSYVLSQAAISKLRGK
jgi:hypothetical protein